MLLQGTPTKTQAEDPSVGRYKFKSWQKLAVGLLTPVWHDTLILGAKL